jgi:hypothetical protein
MLPSRGNCKKVAIMEKDAKRFDETGGWGYAEWGSIEQQPLGEDASFDKNCFGCHTLVTDNKFSRNPLFYREV